MPDFKLEIGAELPAQGLVEKLTELIIKDRETMSQANRDEFDRIRIAMLKGWHNWWVMMGWPGEKV